MIAFLLIFALACPTAPPPAKEVTDPSPDDVVNTITIKVPADCPHLIVDVLTDETADITVAYFSGGTRTYFAHEEQSLVCVSVDALQEQSLIIQSVTDSTRLSSVQ